MLELITRMELEIIPIVMQLLDHRDRPLDVQVEYHLARTKLLLVKGTGQRSCGYPRL